MSPKRPDDSLGKLEALADAKELQLARTHSVRAIENLQAMYGYYIDKGQWKTAAALFSRDGTYEFGQSGVYIGNAHVERALTLMGPPGLRGRPAQQLCDGAAHHQRVRRQPHRQGPLAQRRAVGAGRQGTLGRWRVRE